MKNNEKEFRNKLSRYLSKKDIFEITNFIHNKVQIGNMNVSASGAYYLSDEERLIKISHKLYLLRKRLNNKVKK